MNLNRRIFLAGLGVSTMAHPVLGLTPGTVGNAPYGLVLNCACSEMTPELEALEAAATRTIHINGDVAPVWFSRLQPIWRDQTTMIFGFTRYSDQFLISELARPLGYRMRTLSKTDDTVLWSLLPKSSGLPKTT